jgi:hypothetical protein
MRAFAISLGVVLMLAGCSGGARDTATEVAAPVAAVPVPVATDSPAPAAADASSATPDAARRPPEERLTQGGVYYGCRTDADCTVKDVGNCCGYFPACVNTESPTFPEKVKAECGASGMSAVCGFAEIAGCQCLEGRCTDAPAASGAGGPKT